MNATKKLSVALLPVLAAASAALAVGARPAVEPEAPDLASAPPKGDVVLMACTAGSGGFSVASYQGSTAVPGKRTQSCSQTLSDLLREGFGIRHTAENQDADILLYTLVR